MNNSEAMFAAVLAAPADEPDAKQYCNRQEADDALSRVLVEYGREQARLKREREGVAG